MSSLAARSAGEFCHSFDCRADRVHPSSLSTSVLSSPLIRFHAHEPGLSTAPITHSVLSPRTATQGSLHLPRFDSLLHNAKCLVGRYTSSAFTTGQTLGICVAASPLCRVRGSVVVRAAAAEVVDSELVTYRSISLGDRQRRLHGRWPRRRALLSSRASLQPSSETDNETAEDGRNDNSNPQESVSGRAEEQIRSKSQPRANELNKAVTRTAATFAPRASTASKNPAPPGSTLYKVFEAQAYIAMAIGGALSFNLLFPSDYPDIWRLMGMWSIWMFTVPSLRARDCSKKEKEALNYLFLVIPLVNVTLPIFWRSFAAVWSADVLAFFAFYAWKMDWLSQREKVEDS